MQVNDFGFEVRSIASSNAFGTRIDTLELKYPRFIHSEFMTHRLFSRNASSSRAIPVKKILDSLDAQKAMPIHWGKNQKGMQAEEELNTPVDVVNFVTGPSKDSWQMFESRVSPVEAWDNIARKSMRAAVNFIEAGYHKQIVNRILEPYSFIKVIVTATEWDNFFELRLHPDAQPEIQELARMMKAELDETFPKELDPGSWHVPYYHDGFWEPSPDNREVDLHGNDIATALGISSARCARVSYRLHDGNETTVEADLGLAKMLRESKHMSPFEHQATPMGLAAIAIDEEMNISFDDGVTHFDHQGRYWSGNFRNWVQHRQMKKYA